MKTKFGYMPCPDCGARVVVKINPDSETLSYGCDECDGNGYCKKHEARYSLWLKKIEKIAAPAPAKKPASDPAPKKASTII